MFQSPAFTVFLYQQSVMTLLVSDKSTISQSDHLWWIAYLLFENTGKRYVCYLTCCNSGSITCDVIYIFGACHCDTGNANGSELGSVWAFIKFLPVILTGNKLRITDTVWSPSSCRKSNVFMWKLTSVYCPHCAGSGVSVALYRCRHTAVTCFLPVHWATRCHGWYQIHYPSTTGNILFHLLPILK